MLLVSDNIDSNAALTAAIAGPGGGIGNYLLLTNTAKLGFISLHVNALPAANADNYWCGVGADVTNFTTGNGPIDAFMMLGTYKLYKL